MPTSAKSDMMIDQPWIEIGYAQFSKNGPAGLKIDLMAKAIGISRSSFYHHFADLEVFQEKLLQYHILRAELAAQSVRLCKTMDPDFLQSMVEQKEYILFNRQLRISRHIPEYKVSFESAMALVAKESIGLWAEMMGLRDKPDLARSSYGMTADILFHRLTEENFNYPWLKGFMDEIKIFFKAMNIGSSEVVG